MYDIIGVGIGPFNLGLAALAAPLEDLSAIFFDQAPVFNWHPGMMLSDVTLQVPFMADLVTLADPTSPYSFLNFMNKQIVCTNSISEKTSTSYVKNTMLIANG